MRYVTSVPYAQLRAASLFCEGRGRTEATSGIHLNKQENCIQATDHESLIEIPSLGLGSNLTKSIVIKPQGWFGPTCSYVKIYQDGHEKSIGFMRGYTRSGTPLQKEGFDRLIPVLFISQSFPETAALKKKFVSVAPAKRESVAFDAAIMSKVGQAVKLLTDLTSQVRMRFVGDPVNIIVSDTRQQFCKVYFHGVGVRDA